VNYENVRADFGWGKHWGIGDHCMIESGGTNQQFVLPHNAGNIDLKQPNQAQLHRIRDCSTRKIARRFGYSEAQQAQQQTHMTFPTENVTNEHRGT